MRNYANSWPQASMGQASPPARYDKLKVSQRFLFIFTAASLNKFFCFTSGYNANFFLHRSSVMRIWRDLAAAAGNVTVIWTWAWMACLHLHLAVVTAVRALGSTSCVPPLLALPTVVSFVRRLLLFCLVASRMKGLVRCGNSVGKVECSCPTGLRPNHATSSWCAHRQQALRLFEPKPEKLQRQPKLRSSRCWKRFFWAGAWQ